MYSSIKNENANYSVHTYHSEKNSLSSSHCSVQSENYIPKNNNGIPSFPISPPLIQPTLTQHSDLSDSEEFIEPRLFSPTLYLPKPL